MSEVSGYRLQYRDAEETMFLLPEEFAGILCHGATVHELHLQPQPDQPQIPAVYRSWYWCRPSACVQSTAGMTPHYLGKQVHEKPVSPPG